MYREIHDSIIERFEMNSLPHAFIFWGESSENDKEKFLIDVSCILMKPFRNRTPEKLRELVGFGQYPDFIKIGPSDKGNIKTEEINRLDDILCYDPYESENRIIYISSADAMTIPAQNALLKKLEEPPVNNFFFLTVKKRNSILDTILSRVINLYLPDLNIRDAQTDLDLIKAAFPFVKEHFEHMDPQEVSSEIEKMREAASLLSTRSIKGIDRAETLFGTFEKGPKGTVPNNTEKLALARVRLAILAWFLRTEKPESSKKILKFLENRQFFSIDSIAFFNIQTIIGIKK